MSNSWQVSKIRSVWELKKNIASIHFIVAIMRFHVIDRSLLVLNHIIHLLVSVPLPSIYFNR